MLGTEKSLWKLRLAHLFDGQLALEVALRSSCPWLAAATLHFPCCLVSDILWTVFLAIPSIRLSSKCRSDGKETVSIEEGHQCGKRYPGGPKDLMQLFKMANLHTGPFWLSLAFRLALYRVADGTHIYRVLAGLGDDLTFPDKAGISLFTSSNVSLLSSPPDSGG